MTSKARLVEEVERLTECTQQLAYLLRERIDECTKLEEELEALSSGTSMTQLVQVTTEFGPDLVFATVKVTSGKTFVETEVVSWSLDGQPQPLDSLKELDEATLRALAREKIDES